MSLLDKYLYNIPRGGGGGDGGGDGGGGGGNQGPSSLNAAEGEMSPSQREVSYGGGGGGGDGGGGNTAAADAKAAADAQAASDAQAANQASIQAAHDASVRALSAFQPGGLADITFGPVPTVSYEPSSSVTPTPEYTAPPEPAPAPAPNADVSAATPGQPSIPSTSIGNSTNAANVEAAQKAQQEADNAKAAADAQAAAQAAADAAKAMEEKKAEDAVKSSFFNPNNVAMTAPTALGGSQVGNFQNVANVVPYSVVSNIDNNNPATWGAPESATPAPNYDVSQATPGLARDPSPIPASALEIGKILADLNPIATAKAKEVAPPDVTNPYKDTSITYPGGVIPTPPIRPVEVAVSEAPPAPAPAPAPAPTISYPGGVIPTPIARPTDLAATTTPAPTPNLFENIVKSITNANYPAIGTNLAVGAINPVAGLVNTGTGLLTGQNLGNTIFPDNPSTSTTSPALTYNQPSLTDAQYKDLMNQPGWGSEDPAAIASFNNYNANTYGNLSGPTTTAGELGVGQRTPETMVPKVNSDGTVTMVPNLGSNITSFIENLFNPTLTKVGSDAYLNSTQPHPVTTDNTGNTGGKDIIPPIPAPAPEPITAPVVIPPVVAPPVQSPLATNWSRKYLGVAQDPYSYGYGPEHSFYTSAKGGYVSPLNKIRNK